MEGEGSIVARLAFARVEEEHFGWDCCCYCYCCLDGETCPDDCEGCKDSLLQSIKRDYSGIIAG